MTTAELELTVGEWDVSRSEYHADRTTVSNSALSDFRQSVPMYYLRHVLGEMKREPTDEMNLGTALHAVTLEPDTFNDSVCVAPEVDRRTKYGKEVFAEFEAMSAGRTIITSEQASRCQAMRDALLQHSQARLAINAPGPVEQPIRWQHAETSLWVRNLLDKFAQKIGIVIDIKTSKDPSPAAFARSIVNFGYHCQAALYLRGVREVYGVDAEFLFVVVGSQPPFEVGCYCLDADALALAGRMNEAALTELRQRIDSGDWSSRQANRVTSLSLPNWYRPDVA